MMKKKLLYLALFFTLPLGIASAYTVDDAIMYYLKNGKTPPFIDQLPSKDRIVALQQINQLNTIILTPTVNTSTQTQVDEKEKIEEKIAELKEALNNVNAREYYLTISYKLDDLHKYVAIPYDELPRELRYSQFSFVGVDACVTDVDGTRLIIIKNPAETLKVIVDGKGLPSCSETYTNTPKVESVEVVKDGERLSAQDTFPLDTSKDNVHLKADVKIQLSDVDKLVDTLGVRVGDYVEKIIPITDDVYLKYELEAMRRGIFFYKALQYELYVNGYKVAQNIIPVDDKVDLDLPINITIYKDRVEGQVGGVDVEGSVSLSELKLSQDTQLKKDYSYETSDVKDLLVTVYGVKEDDTILDEIIDAVREIFFGKDSDSDTSNFAYKEEVSIDDYTYNKAVSGNYYTLANIVSLRETSNEEKEAQKEMLEKALENLELLKKKFEEQ